MKFAMDRDLVTAETLAATIGRSPIVIARPASALPVGFEDVDIAVLNWIVAEGRRAGRPFPLM